MTYDPSAWERCGPARFRRIHPEFPDDLLMMSSIVMPGDAAVLVHHNRQGPLRLQSCRARLTSGQRHKRGLQMLAEVHLDVRPPSVRRS